MSEGKDRLKQLRKALNLSQPEFAESIGIPPSMINSIEGGKQKLSVRVALALQEKIIKDKDDKICLVTDKRTRNETDAELRIEWLVAGIGEPFETVIKTKDLYTIVLADGENIEVPFKENIKFFKIADDSMCPSFLIDDYVAVDTDIQEIVNGEYFMISYENETLIRKIYKINKDRYNLVAENEKVMPSQEVDIIEISVIGKPIYKIRFVQ